LFLLVKCWRNSISVWLATGLTRHVSQAVVNTPIISNMIRVKSLMALSVSGSPPAMEMRCTSRRCSQSVSMGLSGVHMVAMLARFDSSSMHVMGPYVVHRCVSMSVMDTSANPNVSSLSAARYK